MTTRSLVAAAVVAAAWLVAGCGGEPDPGTRVTPSMIREGGAIYARACAPCHGTSGRGDGPAAVAFAPRNHTDAEVMERLSDGDIARVIQRGGAEQGMLYMPAQPGYRGEELLALTAYVRSLHRERALRLTIEADDWR